MGDTKPQTPDVVLDIPVKRILAAGLGASLGGSFAAGAPVTDVAISLQGGLGFALGYMAGDILKQTGLASDSNWHDYLPLGIGLAVTLIAGGVVDRATFGLIGGAYVATFFV